MFLLFFLCLIIEIANVPGIQTDNSNPYYSLLVRPRDPAKYKSFNICISEEKKKLILSIERFGMDLVLVLKVQGSTLVLQRFASSLNLSPLCKS